MDRHKAANAQGGTVTGTVFSIAVSGRGQNSAEIVTSLHVGKHDLSFAVYAYPSTEPSVFTSFANLLTLAYLTGTEIDLTWVPGPGPTPQITDIVIPTVHPTRESNVGASRKKAGALSR